MRKKVLAALLAAAVAGTTVFAGTAVFAAENTEEARQRAVISLLQRQQTHRTQSTLCCGSDKL